MWRVTVQGLLAHKLRLALTGIAIVLGVTFIAGTFILTDTLHNTFTSLFNNIYQNVDFEVRGVAQFTGTNGLGVRNPIPESLLPVIRGVPGVGAASGSVGGYAQFVAPDGKAISTGGAPTLGISYDPDSRISALRIVDGRAPTTSDEVVMDEGTADKYGFRVGERVRILLTGAPRTFTITGIARFGTVKNLAGATVAAFDLPTAQAVLGEVGRFDNIDVVDAPGANAASVATGDRPGPPTRRRGGLRADRGQRAGERRRQGALASSPRRCLVFAFISLFVGAFTIFNTFSIIVGQRTRELALLRIVGASRRQVFRSVLGEAAVVGLVSSAVGIGLGVLAAVGIEALLRGFGVSLPAGSPVFETRTVIVVAPGGGRGDRRGGRQPGPPCRAHPAGGRHRRAADRARRAVCGAGSPGAPRWWRSAWPSWRWDSPSRPSSSWGWARWPSSSAWPCWPRRWPARSRASSDVPWPGPSACRASWVGRTRCAALGGRPRRRRR